MRTWPKIRLMVAKSGPQNRFKRISDKLRTLKNKSNSWQILMIWMIWKSFRRLINRCHQGLLKYSQWRITKEPISLEVWISKIHHSTNNRWCKMESNLVATREAKNHNNSLHRSKTEIMINSSRKSQKWVIQARHLINTTMAATKWDSNMTYHNRQAIIKNTVYQLILARTLWLKLAEQNQVWLWRNNNTSMLSWKRQETFLRRSNSRQRRRRKRKKRRQLSNSRTLITKTEKMVDWATRQPLERRLKKSRRGRGNLWSKNVNWLKFKKNSACSKSRRRNFYIKNSNSNSECRKNSGVKKKKKLKLRLDFVSVWPSKKLKRKKN